jgi:hypothetical protein
MARLSEAGLAVPSVVESDVELDRPYFVMPWFPDGSLERVAIETRTLQGRPEVALDLLIQTARTLAQIHEAALAHRDLKPSNILLDGGSAFLTDFGLCLHVDDERETSTGEAVGSRFYIAPENEHGINDSVDQRPADFYAFGKVIWAVLAGECPPAREALLQQEHELSTKTGIIELRELSPLLTRLLNADPRARLSDWDWVHRILDRVRQRLAGEPAQQGAVVPRSLLELAHRITESPAVANRRLQRSRETEVAEAWAEIQAAISHATYELAPAYQQLEDALDGTFVVALSNGGPSMQEVLGLWPRLPEYIGQDPAHLERLLDPPPSPSVIVAYPTPVGPTAGALFLKMFGIHLGTGLLLVSTPAVLASPPSVSYARVDPLFERYTMTSDLLELGSLNAIDDAAEFARRRAQWGLNAIGDYLEVVGAGEDPAESESWFCPPAGHGGPFIEPK